MWLLKLHFSISVLCLMTFFGFMAVYKQQIKDNGWGSEDKKKKSIGAIFIFFVPIMNVLSVILLFMMIDVKKKDFDKMCENAKKDNEVSTHD